MKVRNFFGFSKGETSIKAYFDHDHYNFGDIYKAKCSVAVASVKVKLKVYMSIRAKENSGIRYYNKITVAETINNVPIEAGAQRRENFNLKVSGKGNTPSVKGALIECIYKVKVSATINTATI